MSFAAMNLIQHLDGLQVAATGLTNLTIQLENSGDVCEIY